MAPTVGYARVSSTGQDLTVQLEKLGAAGCERIFQEKRSGVDSGRPVLQAALEYVREGDTLLVTKLDRLARSTGDLYRVISQLTDKGVAFRVLDDPSIDTTSRTGKLVMGVLALIAEFENDIRRERQQDGILKAKQQGVRFGRKRELTDAAILDITTLRRAGETVPAIMNRTGLSKASIYRALRKGSDEDGQIMKARAIGRCAGCSAAIVCMRVSRPCPCCRSRSVEADGSDAAPRVPKAIDVLTQRSTKGGYPHLAKI